MEDQIEKFDPSKLVDGVKDRIKATFVSLIPDDAWNSMVEKELYVFTTGKIVAHHDYYCTDSDGNACYKDWEERIPYDQKPITDNYGNIVRGAGDNISPLQKMIREELMNKFREDLKNYLNSDQYNAVRDLYGFVQISKAIEEIMVKNSGAIFRSVMADFMQQGFEAMRSQVAYHPNQY